jgi:hypothetical protein
MQQPGPPFVERRRDPRYPKAFALWLRRPETGERISGWMLNVSAGGAALLVPADRVPPIGALVELCEMHTTDPLVRETSCPLPPRGRVIRHDGQTGLTRRVAVQFEASAAEPLQSRETQSTMVFRSAPQPPPPPPPVADPNKGVAVLARQ